MANREVKRLYKSPMHTICKAGLNTQNIAANSADALATIEKRDFFVEPPRMGLRRVARALVLLHSSGSMD
ncbi:hypothetical protein FJD32_014030 [Shewanella sp. LC6]|nr:hypothetical protein CEQ32_06805 [Shewanella sp. FDAARGOS_354]QQK60507.1 hypothetical protein FJD32_014030 [Shewanella sp. LC6]